MIKFFFILPLFMSAIWLWYLSDKGYTLKEGLKGFGYILAFNSIIIAFFSFMIWIT